MARELLKGNYAIVKGAALAGCRVYFGYPITPASEIAEAAAYYLPLMGGTFVQAESEVAAINMVYGAAGAGARVMTASSSPGNALYISSWVRTKNWSPVIFMRFSSLTTARVLTQSKTSCASASF